MIQFHPVGRPLQDEAQVETAGLDKFMLQGRRVGEFNPPVRRNHDAHAGAEDVAAAAAGYWRGDGLRLRAQELAQFA